MQIDPITHKVTMTFYELSQAKSEVLPVIAEGLKNRKDLSVLTAQLINQVAQIPYVCGKPDCQHVGCISIRDAQETVRKLIS